MKGRVVVPEAHAACIVLSHWFPINQNFDGTYGRNPDKHRAEDSLFMPN